MEQSFPGKIFYLNIMVQADLSSQVLQLLARVNQTMWELFTRDNSVWRGRLKTEMGSVVSPFKSLPCRGYEAYKHVRSLRSFWRIQAVQMDILAAFPVGRKTEENIIALKMWGDKYYIGSTTGEVRESDPATGKKRAGGDVLKDIRSETFKCVESGILAGGGTMYPVSVIELLQLNGIKIWNLEKRSRKFMG